MLKKPTEMAVLSIRSMNHYKLKYRQAFSARLDKQGEDGLVIDEFESYIYLGVRRNITRKNIHNLNVKFQLGHQILNHEMKDSGLEI